MQIYANDITATDHTGSEYSVGRFGRYSPLNKLKGMFYVRVSPLLNATKATLGETKFNINLETV